MIIGFIWERQNWKTIRSGILGGLDHLMDSFSKHDELHGATATIVCLRTDKRQGQSQISKDIASWWLQACFIFNPCEDNDFIWLPSNKYQNWVYSRGMEIPEVERGNGDFVPSISGGMNHKVPHLFLSVPGTTTEQWPLKPLHGLRWRFFSKCVVISVLQ